eukprot:897729-Rhodomonas_salina.1
MGPAAFGAEYGVLHFNFGEGRTFCVPCYACATQCRILTQAMLLPGKAPFRFKPPSTDFQPLATVGPADVCTARCPKETYYPTGNGSLLVTTLTPRHDWCLPHLRERTLTTVIVCTSKAALDLSDLFYGADLVFSSVKGLCHGDLSSLGTVNRSHASILCEPP